ncbi:MAG: THUMP domain-containing protein [Candidatus Bathyarchaeota archaeon]|nr:MAG: THUMP domain-containing protein [Candidatus Bathyarchaeota archaeon]
MIKEFNLLATSEIRRESEACSELWMLLRAAGDETPILDRSPIRGLIVARTSLDPVEAIRRLRIELHEDPQIFRAILRVMPVEASTPTDLGEIVDKTRDLASKIGESESFRVTLEKRRTGLRSRVVVEAVAGVIDRRVNLEDPDWIVLVEIISRVTGLSVIASDGILNIQKERAKLSAEG